MWGTHLWVDEQVLLALLMNPLSNYMSYFRYQSQIDSDCLLTSYKRLLENAGLLVCEEFSSGTQIFAENQLNQIDTKTKVKVLISWADKSSRVSLVEVRSDEPHLRKDTLCEQVANQLLDLIPAK